MFYGGKLLSHLTVSEDALDDFIELRQLNRASAVVIDSDKTGSRQRISATKKRISDEFQASEPAPGFAWITKCYTIENYLPGDILKAAVEQVHSVEYVPVDQWDNPLPRREDASATTRWVWLARRPPCSDLSTSTSTTSSRRSRSWSTSYELRTATRLHRLAASITTSTDRMATWPGTA